MECLNTWILYRPAMQTAKCMLLTLFIVLNDIHTLLLAHYQPHLAHYKQGNVVIMISRHLNCGLASIQFVG